MLELPKIRRCYAIQLLNSLQKLRVLANHIESISIESNMGIFWKLFDKFGEKLN